MRKKVSSLKIEFESTTVIKCGWEIRLTIITCLGGKKCKGLGQTCLLIKSSFYNKG